MHKNLGYLCQSIAIILQDKHRDRVQRIQYHLCVCLLARFDDMARDYKLLKKYAHCEDVYEFLGELFSTKREYMAQIIDALSMYKNIATPDVGSCLNIKLS